MVCTMLILKKQICGMYRPLRFPLSLLKIQQKASKYVFTAWLLHFLVVKHKENWPQFYILKVTGIISVIISSVAFNIKDVQQFSLCII